MAKTVQNPLEQKYIGPRHYVLRPTLETKTIVQPVGRIGAQIGHVVSKMRGNLLLTRVRLYASKCKGSRPPSKAFDVFVNGLYHVPIFDDIHPDNMVTTINLQVPDSFQLEFYQYLMTKAGIDVTSVYDQNSEAYGPGVVKTAICTEPIEPEKLHGITDYLPLWTEEKL